MPIQIVPQPVITPGAGDVTGGTNLTTANRVMIVAGSSEAGQSDVTLSSGVFSRAGTLGLSATGANSVTLATNGSTRLTIDSSGVSTFAGKIIVPNNTLLSFLDVGAGEGFRIKTNDGVSANAAVINQVNNSYIALYTNNTERVRLTGDGNLLVGTTTDDGVSKLQVSGETKILSDTFIITTSKTPASAATTGTAGQIAWDADYIYVCTATDTWKRVAIATWP